MAPMNTNTHALTSFQSPALAVWAHAARGLTRAAAMARRVVPRRPQGASELQAMSDQELKDLGLGRSELAYALEAGRAG